MNHDPAQLLAQADKAYSSAGSGFSFFGSKTEKLENAAALYIQAANAYKKNKESAVPGGFVTPEQKEVGRQAGMAFEKAAMIQGTKLGEPDDMAMTLQDAYAMYNDGSPEDAARCLSQVIDQYTSKGNFRRAATQSQNLGDTYKNMGDNSKARSAYESAAQWIDSEPNQKLTAAKVREKAAELAALDGDYLAAAKLFEHVAWQREGQLPYSVPNDLMRAGVCHLALDLIGARRALDSYREPRPCPSFPSTDQFRLLSDLLEIAEQGDSEAFRDRFEQYKRRGFRLDDAIVAILARITTQITEKEEDFS